MSDIASKIGELVKPYAYTCDVKRIIDLSVYSSHRTFEVSCTLKPDEVGPGAREPKYVRAALFGSAQNIIEAIEREGFSHIDHPSIRIDGNAVQSYGQPGARLVATGTVDLSLALPEEDNA